MKKSRTIELAKLVNYFSTALLVMALYHMSERWWSLMGLILMFGPIINDESDY